MLGARLLLGELHPLTLAAFSGIAEVLLSLGRPKEALDRFQAVLDSYAQQVPEQAAATPAQLALHGLILQALERDTEALPLLQSAREGLEPLEPGRWAGRVAQVLLELGH